MKTCYLILSPEGCGSRLMAEILIRNGCEGSCTHDQPLADSLTGAGPTIVVRYSLPFGGDWPDRRWPDLNAAHGRLWRAGYEVRVIVILRNAYCAVRSQLPRDLVKSIDEGYRNYSRAVKIIGGFIAENALPCRWATYESLSREMLANLLVGWIDVKDLPIVRDENAKYFP